MAIVKIEEASFLSLDWLTATALGFEPEREGYWDVEQERSLITKLHYQGAEMVDTTWSPSTKIAQCREILVSNMIALHPPSLGRRAIIRVEWIASIGYDEASGGYLHRATASTPELAICRVFCLEYFGPTAEVDDELLDGYYLKENHEN